VTPRTLPRLHVVTDDAVLAGEGWIDRAVEVLEAGGPEVALHVRGPTTPSRVLLAVTETLRPHARRSGAVLLVNDRVDVALVTAVDGVHLGGGSLAAPDARALLGPSKWIGVSRHSVEEAASAAAEGADYLFLGTIFETASHPGVDGLGLGAIRETVLRCGDLPILGIGGIGPAETSSVVGAGAWGVAAIRGIWAARDPGTAVSLYLDGLGN
jgi:thiamine-phosphate diphosphorylase